MEKTSTKTVAVVGRPNVGKSTLFNRLIGRREAIESPVPGTTRDRLFGQVSWRNETFELIDVAGIETGTKGEIAKNVQESIEVGIEAADLLLFIVDWCDKSNDIDRLIARKLRRYKKEIILVINKVDNTLRNQDVEEFKRLGDFPMATISAISGRGTGDLLDLIHEKLKAVPSSPIEPDQEGSIKLVILGRPNVGKSTLLNTLIGQKRAITSAEPGTTRDAIYISFMHKNKKIELSDTAGIRRSGKIVKDTIESFSVIRAWKAFDQADIAIVVIDGNEGITAGDIKLIGEAKERGKGVILAVNKIDLWGDAAENKISEQLVLLQHKLNFAPWLPVVFISAKEQLNTKPLLNQVVKVEESRRSIIPEEDLDAILNFAKESNNQLQNIVKLKQKRSAPPTFDLVYQGKTPPHYTQMRYLENKFRDLHPLNGTPIFIDVVHKNKA
ncbi:MAG: ribosome biogenesis GTPase Der [Patescibacteria group bacterium]|jgi:GTP-binding protein